tara:strand:+ start:221 stop:523 length:303 start_codon:yes stop_codon:yes gene_type:complete
MAKRKTPKADKIVDLKPKAEKITDTQLQNVQTTVRTMDHLTMELGRIDVQKYGILKGIENVQAELDLLRQEMKKEYGTDNINIQDGTINHSDNGEADKKD